MKRSFIITRVFTGITLILAWGLTDSPLLGVAFILFLLALSAIRYHFGSYKWCDFIEAAVCILYSFFWLPALLGLWLAVIGFLEKAWGKREGEILQNEYKNRTEHLKLKQILEHSESQMRKVAHLTELQERTRIAQNIHDHVGHEISGTLIALRTALVLYEKHDERAGELLKQAVSRLESASENLRETVHNLKPVGVSGTDTLRELCAGFTFCDVKFITSGNVSDINSNSTAILIANLKESLTNISKHSNATKADVKLDSNADYIRFTIHDNGTAIPEYKSGMGLNGMRERIRTIGGNMTVSIENGFKIVCIIPKER